MPCLTSLTRVLFIRRRFNRSVPKKGKRILTIYVAFFGIWRALGTCSNAAYAFLCFAECSLCFFPSQCSRVMCHWKFSSQKALPHTHTHGPMKEVDAEWYIRKQTHFYGPIIELLHCIKSCAQTSSVCRLGYKKWSHFGAHKKERRTLHLKWKIKLYSDIRNDAVIPVDASNGAHFGSFSWYRYICISALARRFRDNFPASTPNGSNPMTTDATAEILNTHTYYR